MNSCLWAINKLRTFKKFFFKYFVEDFLYVKILKAWNIVHRFYKLYKEDKILGKISKSTTFSRCFSK